VGCTQGAVVVGDEADIKTIGDNSRLGIVCQTTQSPEFFNLMLSTIAKAGFSEIRALNTLCREAIKRQQAAVELCQKVDIMFVLGGLESANTRKLAELCKKWNNETFHLQNWDEFDKKVVFGGSAAGVTAGASTPQWIIDDFVRNLEAIEV